MSNYNNDDIPLKENIIFLHLPKTAGSTINRIIDRQYEPEVVYTIEGNTLSSLRDFEQLDEKTRGAIRVFKGHAEYGIHRFLKGKSKYFTFLREPIERTLSEYYFILRATGTPYHQYVVDNNLTLIEVIHSEEPLIMMRNTQTMLLAGKWRNGSNTCNNKILDQAKKNLRNHFYVGLTNQFDASVCLFKNHFHWGTDIFYSRINVTQNRPAREAITTDELEAMRKINQYDIELYEYGKTLFEEQVRQMGSLFPTKVKFFEVANKVHGSQGFLKLLHLWHTLIGKHNKA